MTVLFFLLLFRQVLVFLQVEQTGQKIRSVLGGGAGRCSGWFRLFWEAPSGSHGAQLLSLGIHQSFPTFYVQPELSLLGYKALRVIRVQSQTESTIFLLAAMFFHAKHGWKVSIPWKTRRLVLFRYIQKYLQNFPGMENPHVFHKENNIWALSLAG